MKSPWPALFSCVGISLLCLARVSAEVLSGEAGQGGAPSEIAKQWAEGVGSNQVEALEAVLDETYEHIHGTGLVDSRSQFLEALRNGTRKYQPVSLEDLKARSFGETALVTGTFALKVEVRGKKLEGVNRFCMTMVKRPSGWRIVQFQATAVAPR